jgi:hypothetical protein
LIADPDPDPYIARVHGNVRVIRLKGKSGGVSLASNSRRVADPDADSVFFYSILIRIFIGCGSRSGYPHIARVHGYVRVIRLKGKWRSQF